MSRRSNHRTEAAPKTAEAKTMMSDLKSVPPEVKEDGPRVEPVAPDESPPEEARAQPADAPPQAKTEATEAQRTEGQADQADDEDAQDEDEGDPVTGLEGPVQMEHARAEAAPEAPHAHEQAPPAQEAPRAEERREAAAPQQVAPPAEGQAEAAVQSGIPDAHELAAATPEQSVPSGAESAPPPQAPVPGGADSAPPPEEAPDLASRVLPEDDAGDGADEGGEEPVFTDKDRDDVLALEATAKHHGLGEAEAHKEIRRRKLWMIFRNEDGTRRYKRFGDYCADRLGKDKSWVSRQIKWLTMDKYLDGLRALGMDVPAYFNPHVAASLVGLAACGNYQGQTEEEQEEAGLVAVLQEAADEGVKMTGDNMHEICRRRSAYYRRDTTTKPAAPTYEDYRADLKKVEAIKDLKAAPNSPGKVVREQQDSGCSYAEAAGKVYARERARPADEHLLHRASGDGLQEIVDRLLGAHRNLEAVRRAEAEVAAAALAARLAKQARDQALAAAGMPKPAKGKGKGNEEVEQQAELERRFELRVEQPGINPSSFTFREQDGLTDALAQLLAAAEKHTPKAGDAYTLELTITARTVAAEGDGEDRRGAKAAWDAERKLLRKQLGL